MHNLPSPLQDLVAALSNLPGVGRKTALRLAFHILTGDKEENLALADAIRQVKTELRLCKNCFNYAEREICHICDDQNRSTAIICLVEDAQSILLHGENQ